MHIMLKNQPPSPPRGWEIDDGGIPPYATHNSQGVGKERVKGRLTYVEIWIKNLPIHSETFWDLIFYPSCLLLPCRSSVFVWPCCQKGMGGTRHTPAALLNLTTGQTCVFTGRMSGTVHTHVLPFTITVKIYNILILAVSLEISTWIM